MDILLLLGISAFIIQNAIGELGNTELIEGVFIAAVFIIAFLIMWGTLSFSNLFGAVRH